MCSNISVWVLKIKERHSINTIKTQLKTLYMEVRLPMNRKWKTSRRIGKRWSNMVRHLQSQRIGQKSRSLHRTSI